MKKAHSILSLLVISCVIFLSSCSKDDEIIVPDVKSPNVLLIIADDLGKDAINGYQEGSIKPTTPNIAKPWFLWLAYNAPHTPFHVPPAEMHNQGNLPAYTPGMNATPYYMAAIEAMDYQIGRLLDNIPENEKENTIIIFIGDNGTPSQVAQSPYTSSTVKNTLYQGGINVPMFISGFGVSRFGTDNNLIAGTDLFSTISELAGVSSNEYDDSKSFRSLLTTTNSSVRNYQYSELVDGNTDSWTIRNNRYKIIVYTNGNKEMYDLLNDPYEESNLLYGTLTSDETNAKSELESELLNIRN